MIWPFQTNMTDTLILFVGARDALGHLRQQSPLDHIAHKPTEYDNTTNAIRAQIVRFKKTDKQGCSQISITCHEQQI